MINLNELIHRRDKLLKARLRAELLHHHIPYEQIKDALEVGFEKGEAQWKADLQKYDKEAAKILEGLET
jgi:hypothetical protein